MNATRTLRIKTLFVIVAAALILGLLFPLRTMAAQTIAVQPDSITVYTGEKITLTVDAEGEGLTYQWQYKTPSGAGWKTSTVAEQRRRQ